MVICGPQKFQMPPPPPPKKKNRKGAKHGPQNYWPGDNTVTLSLHGRMYYLPKFEACIKRWDPQFQWWDPHHIQSWVPRTPKHSTRCKTLLYECVVISYGPYQSSDQDMKNSNCLLIVEQRPCFQLYLVLGCLHVWKAKECLKCVQPDV